MVPKAHNFKVRLIRCERVGVYTRLVIKCLVLRIFAGCVCIRCAIAICKEDQIYGGWGLHNMLDLVQNFHLISFETK